MAVPSARSTVQQGEYYKQRTAQLLTRQGYTVLSLETKGWRRTKAGWFPFTRDTAGSDLVALSPAKTVWVQVKSGVTARDQRAAARRIFARYPLSVGSEQWTVCWPLGAHEPEIDIVAIGPQPADHPVMIPARRKPPALPLFARAHG